MAFVSCRFLVLFLILMASFASLCHCMLLSLFLFLFLTCTQKHINFIILTFLFYCCDSGTSNILDRKVESKSNITSEKIVVDFCFKFHCNFPTGWEKCYCCTILKSQPCWVDRNECVKHCVTN